VCVQHARILLEYTGLKVTRIIHSQLYLQTCLQTALILSATTHTLKYTLLQTCLQISLTVYGPCYRLKSKPRSTPFEPYTAVLG